MKFNLGRFQVRNVDSTVIDRHVLKRRNFSFTPGAFAKRTRGSVMFSSQHWELGWTCCISRVSMFVATRKSNNTSKHVCKNITFVSLPWFAMAKRLRTNVCRCFSPFFLHSRHYLSSVRTTRNRITWCVKHVSNGGIRWSRKNGGQWTKVRLFENSIKGLSNTQGFVRFTPFSLDQRSKQTRSIYKCVCNQRAELVVLDESSGSQTTDDLNLSTRQFSKDDRVLCMQHGVEKRNKFFHSRMAE